MLRAWFHGTGQMIRFFLRRDRIQLPVWILAVALSTIGISASFPSLYPTAQERALIAQTMNNPAITAMIGPAYGIDNYTYGAMVAHEMLLFMAMTVGVMSILLVTRHTRSDEERGRVEMVRSLPVGRLANVAAAVVVVSGANVLVGLITGLGLYALGIESMDFHGSMLFGAAMSVTGIVFTAIAAIFAQVAETSRGTLGFSFASLGLAYLLRGIGDIGSEMLSLVSPLGLILRTQAYVRNLWWPIWVLLLAALLLFGVALYLNTRRDLGAGVVAARPGRRYATRSLTTPLGLTLRLQRTTLVSWAVTSFVLGAAYGSVFGEIESFFESSEIMQQLLPMTEGFSLTEQFTSVILLVMSMVSAIPPLLVMARLNGEEKARRIDPLLASAVSRQTLIGSYLGVAMIAAVLMPLLSGVGLWWAASAVMAESMPIGTVLGGAVAYVPAILVLIGLAALVVGVRPKLFGLIWLYLVYSFFVLYLGGLLQLPAWMEWLTPFGQVPQLPVDSMRWGSLVVLVLVAGAAMVAGMAGYRRRDIYG